MPIDNIRKVQKFFETSCLMSVPNMRNTIPVATVVSPEISSRKFPEIYSYFSGNFWKIAGTILQGIFYHYKPSK